MKLNRAGLVGLFVVALAVVMVGGCGKKHITGESVRKNMAPEMDGIAFTHEQRANNKARSVNTTVRQFNDDWDRFWLMDQPSRLTVFPVP